MKSREIAIHIYTVPDYTKSKNIVKLRVWKDIFPLSYPQTPNIFGKIWVLGYWKHFWPPVPRDLEKAGYQYSISLYFTQFVYVVKKYGTAVKNPRLRFESTEAFYLARISLESYSASYGWLLKIKAQKIVWAITIPSINMCKNTGSKFRENLSSHIR